MLLQDENDNAPIFEQDKYTFKIKENNEKIKLNKQLPFLVGNVVEVHHRRLCCCAPRPSLTEPLLPTAQQSDAGARQGPAVAVGGEE